MATLIRLAEGDSVAVATRNLERGAAVAVEGEEPREADYRDSWIGTRKMAVKAVAAFESSADQGSW